MSPLRVGLLVGLVVSGAILGAQARHADTVVRPAQETVVMSDAEGELDEILMHYVPGLEGTFEPETGVPLRADSSPETIARFDRAASDLALAGFRVVRIPTVAFDDKTYFAYTNGVYETRAGRHIARIPWFDVPATDDAARAVYESLGWTVIPISARKVYPQHGTIGCLVNVLRRSTLT